MFWNWIWIVVSIASLGMVYAVQTGQSDEDAIRHMGREAVSRLNRNDAKAIRELWDENADYVSVGGKLIRGRQAMEDSFAAMLKEGGGTQTATIEQVRFITPDLAIVDASWTIHGALNATGRPLPPIEGRGVEIVQKKQSRWRFVATREMVVWKP